MGKRIKLSEEEIAQLQPEQPQRYPYAWEGKDRPAGIPGPRAEVMPLGESILRGGAQGATLAHGEELSSGLGAALVALDPLGIIHPESDEAQAPVGDLYKEFKDEEREANRMARKSHPLAYGLSEFGAAVPLSIAAGAVGKVGQGTVGGQVAKTSMLSGAEGATYGAGISESDSPIEVAEDAAMHGVLGVASGPVNVGIQKAAAPVSRKLTAKARERTADQMLEGIPHGRQIRQVKALGGSKERFLTAADEEQITRAWRKNPKKAQELLDVKREQVGEAIGSAFEGADALTEGVRRDDVAAALRRLAQKYDMAENYPARDAVMREISEIMTKSDTRPMMSASTVHGMARRYAAAGYKGQGELSKTVGAEVARDMDEAVRDLLFDHMDKVAGVAPDAVDADGLRALNAQYKKVRALYDLVEYKADRTSMTHTPTLRQVMGTGAKRAPGGLIRGAANVMAAPGATASSGGMFGVPALDMMLYRDIQRPQEN